MNPVHLHLAEQEYDTSVKSLIQLQATTGERIRTFSLPIARIKKMTKAVRVHGSMIQEYIKFFRSVGAFVVYRDEFEEIHVQLDLDKIIMTSEQALFWLSKKSLIKSSSLSKVISANKNAFCSHCGRGELAHKE